MNATGDAVLGIDTSGRLTYVNKVAQQLLAREASSLYGVEFAQACRIYNVDSKTNLSNLMAVVQAAELAAPAIRGSVLVRSDGAEVPIEYSISPLYDPRGVLAGAVFVFRDLSESLAMTERMSYLAHHDFLTDLPNRMLLNDRLSQCIVAAERHNRRLAILFLDLDGFKLINDSLGHSIGDELLKEVAQRLMVCVRRSDTVSRQGGDEFVVLLAEVSSRARCRGDRGKDTRRPGSALLHFEPSASLAVQHRDQRVSRRRPRRRYPGQKRRYRHVSREGDRPQSRSILRKRDERAGREAAIDDPGSE